jgi:hypothetical protein
MHSADYASQYQSYDDGVRIDEPPHRPRGALRSALSLRKPRDLRHDSREFTFHQIVDLCRIHALREEPFPNKIPHLIAVRLGHVTASPSLDPCKFLADGSVGFVGSVGI